ncbi:MAG TPA: amidohydrolase family protein [Candidatus Nitrosotenuis sp.]|nr:amidohydrolase family protein [Candidatus Nitrosotenuis sp.]
MLLKNVSVLYGKNLEYIPSATLQTSNGLFVKQSGSKGGVDCQGLLLVPGFVNMHTHIGDSIGKDAALKGSVDSKIHPMLGAKKRILSSSSSEHLANFMKSTCYSMLKKGITTFVDFREGGLEGIMLLRKVLEEVPIRGVILGRVEYYQDKNQIRKNIPLPTERRKELESILKHCDGIGISGPNENSDSVLRTYSRTKKIRAIHSAETQESSTVSKEVTKRSETARALLARPHFLVHMTYASGSDLNAAAKKTRGIVVCPRANASLAEGIPDFVSMQKSGCTVAIGTDNVMINSPDMFREMDYTWKVHMGLHKKRLDPKQILKMATVNGGVLLRRKIGSIEPGYVADGILFDKHALDFEPMLNPHAAIVHRASESTIRAVMVGGKIVHGKI